MRTGTRIILASLLCGSALLCTAGEASAQRGWRFARAVVSPWDPIGPVDPPRYYRPYYTSSPTYVANPTYTTATPLPPAQTVTQTFVSTNIGRPAELKIMVPPDAEVTVNGAPIGQRGTTARMFVTPPLERGWAYSYRVTARFNDRGGMVTHDRNVSVAEGEQQIVDFNRPDAPRPGPVY